MKVNCLNMLTQNKLKPNLKVSFPQKIVVEITFMLPFKLKMLKMFKFGDNILPGFMLNLLSNDPDPDPDPDPELLYP